MSEQISPGDGWRLLGPDEFIQSGDEVWSFEKESWSHPQTLLGLAAYLFHVRRRIPAKPNVLEIQSEGGSISLEASPLGPAWLIQRWEDSREEVRLDTTEQIRQVIAWLQQVAEWREAQESK